MERTTPASRPQPASISRRAFLGGLGGGAVALTGLPLWAPAARASGAAAPATVADAKFASVLAVGEKAWAVVSKPLEGGYETLCNGGLIAGKERLLAFDSYAGAAGAEWVLAQAKALTGHLPTDLVLSHHHGDHVGGLASFAAAGEPPRVWLTQAIRERILPGQLGPVREMLESAELLEPGKPRELDLGGRSVTLTPYSGHTPSDVVARADGVTFFGDLLWNGLFPNYMDAVPSQLKHTIATLLADPTAVNVPGHGALPERSDLERYRALLDEVEATARAAFEAGKSPAEAAAGYRLPESLGEWRLFNPRYFQTAFTAWHRVLEKA